MRILTYLMGNKIQPTSLSFLESHAAGIFLDRTPGLLHLGHCRGQIEEHQAHSHSLFGQSLQLHLGTWNTKWGREFLIHKTQKASEIGSDHQARQLPTHSIISQVLVAPLSTPCGNPSQEVLTETHSVSFMTSSSVKFRKRVVDSRWITVKLFPKVPKGSWGRDRISNLQSSFPYTSLLFGHKRYVSSRKVNGSIS